MRLLGMFSIVFLGSMSVLSGIYRSDVISTVSRPHGLRPPATPSPRKARPSRIRPKVPATPASSSIPEKEDEVIVSTSGMAPVRSTPTGTPQPRTRRAVAVPRTRSSEKATPSTTHDSRAASSQAMPIQTAKPAKSQDVEVENDETHRSPRTSRAPGYIGETEKNVTVTSANEGVANSPTVNAKGTDVAMEDLHVKRSPKAVTTSGRVSRPRKKSVVRRRN